METTIYYFSATGNSLKIARDLNEKINNSILVPIVKAINEKKIVCNTKKAGFVFPIYYLGLPNIIHRFLDKINLTNVNYIFTVIISGGGNINAMQQVIKKLKDKQKKLDSGFYIVMGSNNKYRFSLKNENEMHKVFKEAAKKINRIAKIINYNETKIEHGLIHMNFLLGSKINDQWLKEVNNNDKKYYIESTCNSCNICTKVCPVDNISLENGIPVFHHNCEECRACIHLCPQNAIKTKEKTFLKKQYINPEIKVSDIINQKN